MLNPKVSQAEVYRRVALQRATVPLLSGRHAALMMYGQTGSGKTHTAFGPPQQFREFERSVSKIMAESVSQTDGDARARIEEAARAMAESPQSGLVVRVLADVFAALARFTKDGVTSATLTVAFTEIYEERAMVHVKPQPVSTLGAALRALATGLERRQTHATNSNKQSSRSHAIFSLELSQRTAMPRYSHLLLHSRLDLVDLAGSERVSKTGAEGVRLQEACTINSSLFHFSRVLHALVERNSHVPYHESTLTRMLANTLGADRSRPCSTTLVLTCAMDGVHMPETLSTLRFGERAALIEFSASMIERDVGTIKNRLRASASEIAATLTLMRVRGNEATPRFLERQEQLAAVDGQLMALFDPLR